MIPYEGPDDRSDPFEDYDYGYDDFEEPEPKPVTTTPQKLTKSREFRPGDIVRIRPEFQFDRPGYDDEFVVVRCLHVPNTYDEYDYDDPQDYHPQTHRESVGHSQHVEIRVTRHKRHFMAFKVMRWWRNRKTSRYSGACLTLVRHKDSKKGRK